MLGQPIVRQSYIIYLHPRGFFFNNFLHYLFRKRVYNSKEIVDLEDFFILSVSCVDMTTYPPTKYYFIIERLYVIYRLLVLIISTFSFLLFLYTVSWRYKRDYLHARIDILLCIILYIINTMKKHYKLFLCLVRTYDTKKAPISTCPPPLSLPSPLFIATSVKNPVVFSWEDY